MITHHKVDGYENFLKLMKVLDCKRNVVLYFHGTCDPAGLSWSNNCNACCPVILDVLKKNETKILHFVAVGTGTYKEWMDRKCPFRTDKKVHLSKLPTLLLWRTQRRLSGMDCIDARKLKRERSCSGNQPFEMITYHKVEGYEACVEKLKGIDEKFVLIYFAGSLDENGENWCSDCREAEPIVEDVIKENEHKTFHFIHVAVGSKEQWKDPACPFRTDEKFKLRSIPTLMLQNSVQRLVERECQDKDNIRMLLEEVD